MTAGSLASLSDRAAEASAAQVAGPARRNAYLPFVDGLRAVSIIAVLAAHAGVPFLAGGYVGVDVFFVISGFLILGHTRRELRAGTFSLFAFFARRVLRIFPALVTMIGIVMLLALIFPVTPQEIKEYYRSADASALFWANIYFFNRIDYFALAANVRPFLHMWSLAVEEQFYIAVALLGGIAVLASRSNHAWSPRIFTGICAVIFLASAGATAFWMGHYSPAAGFYLTPFRGWELLAGGAAALVVANPPARLRTAGPWVAGAGLALIVAAMVLTKSATTFPVFAIAPVVGAVLVLVGGSASRAGLLPILSNRPMVFIGRLSYPLYLFHWPMLVLMATASFGEWRAPGILGALVASFLLAYLTFAWVERPLFAERKRKRSTRGNALVVFSGLAAILLVVGVDHLVYNGWRQAQNPTALAAYENAGEQAWDGCPERQINGADICVFGRDAAVSAFFWGDSHAMHLAEAGRRAADAMGRTVAMAGFQGCVPLLDSPPRPNERPECVHYREDLRDMAPGGMFSSATGFVLAGRWTLWLSAADEPVWNAEEIVAPSEAESSVGRLIERLSSTLSHLQAGDRRVLLVAQVPAYSKGMRACLFRADTIGGGATKCGIARAEAERQRARAMQILHKAADGLPNVRMIDPFSVFCDDRLCLPTLEGRRVYLDADHLNRVGSAAVYAAFKADFDWVLGDGR